jgi:hypothetical protein
MMPPTRSQAFLRICDALVERLIPAYASAGDLAFAYAQGSLVEGLAESADLDLVLVWDTSPPPKEQRPPEGLADPSPMPTVFEELGFVLDRFWLDGQQIDAKHVTTAEVDAWVGAVEAGGGRHGYPMPVVWVHGLVNAVVLSDDRGVADELRRRLQHVPLALRSQASDAAVKAQSAYPGELTAAAERGDGLLFHSLATEYLRTLFIAWFADNDVYWPHEKRLSTRLRWMERDDLADLEKSVWTAENLVARLAAINRLSEQLS